MTATTFIAAVGDIRRFREPCKLVSYLGLDPKVRQSGIAAARHGRISKQGAAPIRQMLGEAAYGPPDQPPTFERQPPRHAAPTHRTWHGCTRRRGRVRRVGGAAALLRPRVSRCG
jgi:hypothetical protein